MDLSNVSNLAQPLVGRDRELEVLRELLQEVRAGFQRFVFVTGRARDRQDDGSCSSSSSRRRSWAALALRGSAAEFERDLPFGLLVDGLDEYLESLEPRAVQPPRREQLGELAGVFPALRSLDALIRPARRRAAERFRVLARCAS